MISGHARAHLDVAIEADPLRDAERRRLSDIVQQSAHRERNGGIAKMFQHHQRVDPDVAFGMILGGLLDALHSRHLGKDLLQQAGLVQQLKAAARRAFRQDAAQLLAYAFGRDRPDERVQASHSRKRGRFDTKAEPRGETDRA